MQIFVSFKGAMRASGLRTRLKGAQKRREILENAYYVNIR